MVTLTKWHIFGAAAIAVVMALPMQAAAAEAETILIQEKGTISDTVTADKVPTAADGVEPAVKPFHGKREMLPAGSAYMGEDMVDGKPVADVVNYASTVASRTPNELVLNTTISKMEDDATLGRIAQKVYMENGGARYQNVTIFWHIGQNPEPATPWARTDIAKESAVYEIIKLQK